LPTGEQLNNLGYVSKELLADRFNQNEEIMAKTTEKKPTEFALPGPKASPGEIADARMDLETRQKVANAEVKRLEGLRVELDEIVRAAATKLKGTGFAGKSGAVEVVRENKLVIDTEKNGWDKFYTYIKKTGSFDLLQKRIGEKAVQDRIDSGVKMETLGLTTFAVDKVKVKAVK
jgi:hypothetical protein